LLISVINRTLIFRNTTATATTTAPTLQYSNLQQIPGIVLFLPHVTEIGSVGTTGLDLDGAAPDAAAWFADIFYHRRCWK